MPNHCSNDLYVSGDSDKVKEFLTKIGADKDTPEFDCDAIIPYPEKFKQMDAEARAFSFFGENKGTPEEQEAAREAYKTKWGTEQDGFNSGGYEWCCDHWGTKWGTYDVVVFEHPVRGTCITFNSAWSPPTPVIKKCFELFPELYFEFEFFEQGAAFCGGVYYNPEAKQYDEDPVREWEAEYSGPRGG